MSKLERQLGLLPVVAISLSTMLGSGLFVLPGLASAMTGPSVWMAYLVAALAVLPAALSKAELGTAMPTSGGTYVYIDRSFGPLVGTIAGIGLWLSLLLKSSFALVGFSTYLAVFTDLRFEAAALIMLAAIVALNIRGVRKVGQVQSAVIAVAVITLGVLFAWGLRSYHAEYLEPSFTHGSMGFLAAAGFVFVSYAGVTKIAAFAEEVKQPGRNLPLGMLLSLGIAAVIYGAVSHVLVAVVPGSELVHDLHPIYTLAETIGGHTLGIIAAVVGVLTMASMANGGVLAASRFPYAMSRDQLLPSFVGRLHARFVTPRNAILLSGANVAAFILLLRVEKLAKLASSFMLILFLAENVAVIVLRESRARWYRPAYRSPLYPWTQVAGILLCALLLSLMGSLALAATAAICIPGAGVYFAYGRPRSQRRGVLGLRGKRKELFRSATTATTRIPEASEMTTDVAVVVALFGEERSPELLVEHAAALAEGGPVAVVSLRELPEQIGLDAVLDDPRLASVRRRVEAVGDEKGIRLHFDSIATRDLAKTVYDLTSRVHCEWLVIGWGGRGQHQVTFSNPLGWLKNHIDCNLAVFNDAGIRYYRKLLVYPEPGPHDALVTRTADMLASVHKAGLTLVRYLPVDAGAESERSELEYLKQLAQLCSAEPEIRLLRGRREDSTIGEASASYDLLVTSEPPETLVGRIMGVRRDRLTAAAASSVLRLQTPRSQTHSALERTSTAKSSPQVMSMLLRTCCIARAPVQRKDQIFERLAQLFADALEQDRAAILEGLHARERSQNTAVGYGVALPHATVSTIDRTYLAVVTTEKPIDYQAPDGEGVDVLFATIGPPSERQTHLQLLAAVSKMVLQSGLLQHLRGAESGDEIVALLNKHSSELAL